MLDGALSLSLRCFDTKADIPPSYVALSHCWSASKAYSLRTTLENLESRKTVLDWNELSQTFKDAVEVTKAVSVRYLWIDSICIVQDDKKDLTRELSIMGKIYAASYVTLAAHYDPEYDPADLTASTDGLFLHSGKKYVRIEQQSATGETYPTIVSTAVDHRLDKIPPSLMKRAWCLQERILSPRVLHFRKDDVVFECARDRHCECRDSDSISSRWSTEMWLKKYFASISNTAYVAKWRDDMNEFIATRGQKRTQFKANTKDVWKELVQEYSRAELTYATDKLSALAGIAEKFPEEDAGVYVAGLWSKHLHSHLLWSLVRDPGARPYRYAEYIAPSFSWACISAPIELAYFDYRVLRKAEIFRASCKPQDENLPFGKVHSKSFLKLRCYVRLFSFKKRSRSGADDLHLDMPHFLGEDNVENVSASADTMEDVKKIEGGKVVVAEILHQESRSNLRDFETLILSPHPNVRGAGRHEYDRVGRATFRGVYGDLFEGCEYRVISLF